MGLSGLEPPTSRLSGVRSNQLSYKPILKSFDSIRICLMQSSLSPRNKFLGHGNPHMRPHLLLYPEASFLLYQHLLSAHSENPAWR